MAGETFTVTAIGVVRSSRREPVDDDWDSVSSTIELHADRFGPAAVAGLSEFSHVDVVYLFDQVGVMEQELTLRG